MKTLILSISFLVLTACSSQPPCETQQQEDWRFAKVDDERQRMAMVGSWVGEIELASGGVRKELFRAFANGRFEVTFVKRFDGVEEVSKEIGLWGVSGPIHFTKTTGWMDDGKIKLFNPRSAYYDDAYKIIRLDQEYFEYESFKSGNRFVLRHVPDDFSEDDL